MFSSGAHVVCGACVTVSSHLGISGFSRVQDAKVVDNACLALSRIAEAFAHKPDSLNMLCEHGLITNALQLVSLLAAVTNLDLPSVHHHGAASRKDARCYLSLLLTSFETLPTL